METATEITPSTPQHEIIEHHVGDQYVTYIVDVWKGERDDPATDITRYLVTYTVDSPALEDEEGNAINPDLGALAGKWEGRWNRPSGEDGAPLLWEQLGKQIKQGSHDAKSYRDTLEHMLTMEAGTYRHNERIDLFQKFMKAVDVLADDPDNEEAWAACDAWKKYNAERHER